MELDIKVYQKFSKTVPTLNDQPFAYDHKTHIHDSEGGSIVGRVQRGPWGTKINCMVAGCTAKRSNPPK